MVSSLRYIPFPREQPPSLKQGHGNRVYLAQEVLSEADVEESPPNCGVMVSRFFDISCVAFALLWPWAAPGALADALAGKQIGGSPPMELSLVLETRGAVRRGIEWLMGHQSTDGSWGGAVRTTALATLALRSFRGWTPAKHRAPLEQGLRFLRQAQAANGGFDLTSKAPVEATALAILAFQGSDAERPLPPVTGNVISRATEFLLQMQDKNGGFLSAPAAGSNLAATCWALWALNACLRDPSLDEGSHSEMALRAATARAMKYVKKCQAGAGALSETHNDTVTRMKGLGNQRVVSGSRMRPSPNAASVRLTAAGLFALDCEPGLTHAKQFHAALHRLARHWPPPSTTEDATEAALFLCLALRPHMRLRSLPSAVSQAAIGLRTQVVQWLLSLQRGDGSWSGVPAVGQVGPLQNDDRRHRALATAQAVLGLESVTGGRGRSF